MTENLMENETVKDSVKGRINHQQDFEYISNDPDENADNFDPKWAQLRELNTDEERYQSIRKRWGNSSIPDPSVNLTFRHLRNSLPGENNTRTILTEKYINPIAIYGSEGENNFKSVEENSRPSARNKERTYRPPRRSRSCTRPYEDLISNLEKNYFAEYCQLMYKQQNELQEMLQIQSLQTLGNYSAYPEISYEITPILKIQQKKEVFHLLSNHYQQIRSFIGKKNENIDACKRYMEEVKAFFTFYQKINENEVTLQMTDEQYEHTAETERMYSLYSQYYS